MKELIVLLLGMLTLLGESKPLQKVKRSIVKDYFNPLTYPTDKLQFEKAEDGNYHKQKKDEPVISKVEYAIAHGIDSNNEIFGETLNPLDENFKNGTGISNTSLRPMLSGSSNGDLQKESIQLSAKLLTADNDKLDLRDPMQEKAEIPEATEKLDSERKSEDSAIKYETSAKLDIPIDSKWSLVPKPDGKDDKHFEGGEVYPEIPVPAEKDGDEKKVEIGQIPKHDFFPSNIPFIPKTVQFRVLSLISRPPVFEITDRLPLPEPEVIEESSETAVVENISPKGPLVRKEGKRFLLNHFTSPLRFGLHLPFLPVAKGLKEAVDEEKLKGLVKSEVLDVGGLKMLLQKKVLKSPNNDPSHFHISVMSLRPLEDVDPKILTEVDKKKKEIESEETSLRKEPIPHEKKDIENRFIKGEGAVTDIKSDEKKGKEVFFKFLPEPEVLDAKKPEVVDGKAVDSKWSSSEVSVPTNPVVELSKENKKLKKDGKKAKEVELESKPEVTKESKESHAVEESGLKTEIIMDENARKSGTKEILPEEVMEKEKTTAIAKEDKDVLIQANDLLKFRNQEKSHMATSIPHLIIESSVDVSEGKLGFDSKSQTKDEEVAQSKKVEVILSPVDESEFKLEKAITEGKKVNEGMLNAEEAVDSDKGLEFRTDKDTKEQSEILKIESKDIAKLLPGEDEIIKKAVSTNSPTEIPTKKESKAKTEGKIESKQIDDESKFDGKKGDDESKNNGKKGEDESKLDGKKGDDDMLNAGDISHSVKEIAADKEVKEKFDKNLENSDKKSPEIEDMDLTKTEVPLLEEKKKKIEVRKDKVSKKKKKCKCEDSDESDSEDEVD